MEIKTKSISIIVGALVVTLLVAYYFIARPVLNERKFNACLQKNNDEITKAITRDQAAEELKRRVEEVRVECSKKYPQ
jgi:hypothetical protein